jgi:hypothetical protein
MTMSVWEQVLTCIFEYEVCKCKISMTIGVVTVLTCIFKLVACKWMIPMIISLVTVVWH